MYFEPVSRRAVLKATGAIAVFGPALSLQACVKEAGNTNLQLFLIPDKNQLTFVLPRSEMGQDIVTTFAMLIAEELEAPLDSIKVQLAGASTEIPNQMTVGSASVKIWWQTMRQIGANTKLLLIREAARKYKRSESEFYAKNGFIESHDSSLKLPFSDLIHDIRVPGQVVNAELKSPQQFRLIGYAQNSLFNQDKSTGAYQYLCDIEKPARALNLVSINYKSSWPQPSSERLNGLKKKYGLEHAYGIAGTIGAFDYRIFLVHAKTWPLLKAKTELELEKREAIKKLPDTKTSAFEAASKSQKVKQIVSAERIELTFETPAIAHAPMEPPCASILYTANKVEVWAPTQAPDIAQAAIAKRLGIEAQHVVLHTIPMGGAFGRKRYTDYLEELALAAKALQPAARNARLTLVWTREDDLNREHYRPATLQTVQWQKQLSEQLSFHVNEGYVRTKKAEAQTIQSDLPLGLAVQATKTALDHYFTSGIWRSVHHGYHAFALCSAIDEICRQSKVDPVSFYLNHPKTAAIKSRVKSFLSSQKSPAERLSAAITQVKKQASWRDEINSNPGMGFAAYTVFDSQIALIAKVSLIDEKQLKVDRVWAAIDCGLALNPDKVKAQLEGGILYGLSACLFGNIHKNKDSESLNFDTLPVLRMANTPRIDIEIMENNSAPTGVGELGVPVIAPAVCNAIRSLTNNRFTKLPLTKDNLINYDNSIRVSPS